MSLPALVQAAGVVLKPQGKSLVGLCPFHGDTSPSLSVDSEKNLWHCFGCNAGGSVIDWVMKAQGVGLRHALELLRERTSLPAMDQPVRNSTVRRLASPVEPGVDDQKLLGQVIHYYHQTLKNTPTALAYLQKRDLCHGEVVDHFQLGFADRTLGLRIPPKNRKEGAQMRERLTRVGIYRPSGHEHFNGSLVFPIMDTNGIITGAYGRKITPHLRSGTPLHLYLPGPHKGFFNPRCLISPEVILCEAIIDALSFWVHDFRHVTAAYGTGGFTEEMFRAFLGQGIRRVYNAYDPDPAGDKAAEQLALRLIAEGIECLRVTFPPGVDANALICSNREQAGKNLAALIDGARPMNNGHKVVFYSILDAEETNEGNPAQEEGGAPESDVPSPLLAAIEKAAKEENVNNEENSAEVLCNRCVTEEQNGESNEQVAFSSLAAIEKAAKEENVDEQKNGEITEQHSSPSLAAIEEGANEGKVDNEKHATTVTSPSCPTVGQAEAAKEEKTQLPIPLDIPAKVGKAGIEITLGDRHYRIGGLGKNLSFDSMRITIRVVRDDRFHVDTLELYNARQRQAFIKITAAELGCEMEIIKRDMGRMLLKLEQLQEQQINRALKPEKKEVVLSEKERQEALDLLHDPHLLERVGADFARCGLVGEESNILMLYLALTSRKLDDPLAVIIQALSAAGKTALMDAGLAFMPDEEVVHYTAMTGQSLFYMGETDLVHKVLAISEEEGAEKAFYPLKIMQSERSLRLASTGKDPKSGRFVTHEYKVEGPAQTVLSTTADQIDEELQNRGVVLTSCLDREQTQAIHRKQREHETIEGLLMQRERLRILRLHNNAQRLLKPIMVVNPYAPYLTFLDTRLRTRRDHLKYLTLIRAVALLHQYQRPVKKKNHQGQIISYIEATMEDIALANRLVNEIMGTSLDELAPQTRRFLEILVQMVQTHCQRDRIAQSKYRFTRKTIRDYSEWSDTQVRVHMERLVELEYVLIHNGNRGSRFVYELLYQGQGQDGKPFLLGLIDVDQLKKLRA